MYVVELRLVDFYSAVGAKKISISIKFLLDHVSLFLLFGFFGFFFDSPFFKIKTMTFFIPNCLYFSHFHFFVSCITSMPAFALSLHVFVLMFADYSNIGSSTNVVILSDEICTFSDRVSLSLPTGL